MGRLGTDRIGFYAMIGEAPTFYLTNGGPTDPASVIPGSGRTNRPFNREGFVGQFYFEKLDFQVVTQHGWDSAWFGAGYGDFPGGNAVNNLPGTTASRGSAIPHLERIPVRNSLRLQPAAHLYPAIGVGAHVAAGLPSRLLLYG